ncbi:Hypothetical protein HVR_LOCUS1305 [uncultured virus]|nr:Hypothetical protein HVR_LOCUS1305 [uncultured virus]
MEETSDIEIVINPADSIVESNIITEPPIIEHSPSYDDFDRSIEICKPNECVPCEFIESRLDTGQACDALITPAEPTTSLDGDNPNIEDVSKPQIASNKDSDEVTLLRNTSPLHKMPVNIKSPSANYYCPISWERFRQWSLVRFSTPMDNHCLFHSISNSFFAPYHNQELNGKKMTRSQMVTHLRRELSKKLGEVDPSDPENRRYYDMLNDGNTAAFAEAVPEFQLKYMQQELGSQVPIGYGYMEFIGNALQKDIYILEAARQDIYKTDELRFTIKGNRRSIILYYMSGHYELVGIQNLDGTFDTQFAPDHSLIRFLNFRVQELIKEPQS